MNSDLLLTDLEEDLAHLKAKRAAGYYKIQKCKSPFATQDRPDHEFAQYAGEPSNQLNAHSDI